MDTQGLSRKEHLLVKIEDGQPFTAEEAQWAAEVLSDEELAAYSRSIGDIKTWYFTFGVGQPNAGHYIVIRDVTYAEARSKMIAAFGREWAFQYDEEDWYKGGVSQAEKWNLKELR